KAGSAGPRIPADNTGSGLERGWPRPKGLIESQEFLRFTLPAQFAVHGLPPLATHFFRLSGVAHKPLDRARQSFGVRGGNQNPAANVTKYFPPQWKVRRDQGNPGVHVLEKLVRQGLGVIPRRLEQDNTS